jgi:hypothetical protein
MKGRQLPWIVAAIALIAFAASFSELQRMRGRFGDITRHQDRHHPYYRQYIIRSEMAEADGPIVVIGDGITERAPFPKTIDGRRVINAGIGSATVEDFERIAPIVIERQPFLIVIALGTDNTAESLRTSYPVLLIQLKKLSPRLLAVGVTPQENADSKNANMKAAAEGEGVRFVDIPLAGGSTLPDHVHLNAAGYQKWVPALVAAISDDLAQRTLM